jgi:hypothetical protein
MILKIQKMRKYNLEICLTSEYYRQLDFNEKVAKKYCDKFMILDSYGILENYSYQNPKVLNNQKIYKSDTKNISDYLFNSYYLIYEPLLENTFIKVKNIVFNDNYIFTNFIIQIIEIINLYRKEGFIHADINLLNIMYRQEKNKYIWYIIDYGNITNVNYPYSLMEEKKIIKYPNFNLLYSDLLHFINVFCIVNSFNNNINDESFLKFINNSNHINEIKEYIPNNIQNINEINKYIKIITKILYPKLFSLYFNLYDNFKEQPLKNLLLLCIMHSNDITYDELLVNLKKSI